MRRVLLQNKIEECSERAYPIHSRVHPLQGFSTKTLQFFVKREDELGFGVSGYKFRKYRTLLPYIRKKGCKEVVLIGGPFSNHIFSLTQLLIENGLQPSLFLKGPKPTNETGNFLFLQMLVPPCAFHWVDKKEWDNVNVCAERYAASRKALVIPEGASIFPSFIGALTLPLDILQNEEEMGLSFDHVFISKSCTKSRLNLVEAFLGFKSGNEEKKSADP